MQHDLGEISDSTAQEMNICGCTRAYTKQTIVQLAKESDTFFQGSNTMLQTIYGKVAHMGINHTPHIDISSSFMLK